MNHSSRVTYHEFGLVVWRTPYSFWENTGCEYLTTQVSGSLIPSELMEMSVEACTSEKSGSQALAFLLMILFISRAKKPGRGAESWDLEVPICLSITL